MIIFIINALNKTVRDPSDIEQKLGIPVFSTIPYSIQQVNLFKNVKKLKYGATRNKDSNTILAYVDSHDTAIESLKNLRTSLQFTLIENINNKIIIITGPTPNVGKSFVSVNFAAVLAQADKRVLLIDGDLRKGYLNQYFGISKMPGLSEAIVGSKEITECIHRTEHENLDFIATGRHPPNPAELLMKKQFETLLSYFSKHYDLIIIDTPPLLPVTDYAIIAKHSAIVFSVVRAEYHEIGELELMKQRFEYNNIPLTGVIFNGFRAEHGYGYYKNKYKYQRMTYAPAE